MNDTPTSDQTDNATATDQPSELAPSSDATAERPVAAVAATAPAAATPQKSGGKALSVVAILLSLAALGGTGYNWYTNQVQSKLDDADLAVGVAQIGGQVTRLSDSISNLQTQQSNTVSNEQLTTRLLESNSAVDLKFRDVQQSQRTLQSAFDKVNADLQRGVNDFVIDEVAQLLRLANNSVLFSNNTRSAIKALTLADEQLKDLADPRYSGVRRKINEEIGALESVSQVDAEAISVKLKNLASRVPDLKLENETPVLGKVVVEVEPTEQGVMATLKEIGASIIDFNSIQRIDQAPKPLLAPEQRYFLDQNIQLQLAKAELGLVQQSDSVYSDSLAVATIWLNEYFDTRDTAVQEVLAQIDALKREKLRSDLPAIAGSYTLLQSLRGGK